MAWIRPSASAHYWSCRSPPSACGRTQRCLPPGGCVGCPPGTSSRTRVCSKRRLPTFRTTSYDAVDGAHKRTCQPSTPPVDPSSSGPRRSVSHRKDLRAPGQSANWRETGSMRSWQLGNDAHVSPSVSLASVRSELRPTTAPIIRLHPEHIRAPHPVHFAMVRVHSLTRPKPHQTLFWLRH